VREAFGENTIELLEQLTGLRLMDAAASVEGS